MVFQVNHLAGTSKPNNNSMKPKKPLKNYQHTHKQNQMKLTPGLGASYTIWPGNGVGLIYSPDPHGAHLATA